MRFSRIAVILLALTMLFTSAGCGKEEEKPKTTEKKETISETENSGDGLSTTEDAADDRFGDVLSESSPDIDFDELLDALLSGENGNTGYTTEEVAKGQYSIITGTSARLTSAKISNANARNCGKLAIQKELLCDYDDNWAFNHAACITYFKGKFYVTWMQGRANEDDLGQRIMISTSTDFNNWTTPVPLSDTCYGKVNTDIETVQAPSCWFNNGKSLIAIYSVREYKRSALRQNNDGTPLRPLTYEWERSDSFSQILYANGIFDSTAERSIRGGNHSAFQLKSGRWIFPGSTNVRYSDDSTGLGAWVQSGLSQAQIDSATNRGAVELCEADAYQTDDGVLHLLMRSETQYLWHTQSYDDGETWSDAYPTKFTNDFSKFDAGRLPDGRYYIVSNTVRGSNRCPLTICLSDDGYNFNKEYIILDEKIDLIKEGLGKGGVYGYPTCTIVNDYFYVAYSVNKEKIEVARFKLSELK